MVETCGSRKINAWWKRSIIELEKIRDRGSPIWKGQYIGLGRLEKREKSSMWSQHKVM